MAAYITAEVMVDAVGKIDIYSARPYGFGQLDNICDAISDGKIVFGGCDDREWEILVDKDSLVIAESDEDGIVYEAEASFRLFETVEGFYTMDGSEKTALNDIQGDMLEGSYGSEPDSLRIYGFIDTEHAEASVIDWVFEDCDLD